MAALVVPGPQAPAEPIRLDTVEVVGDDEVDEVQPPPSPTVRKPIARPPAKAPSPAIKAARPRREEVLEEVEEIPEVEAVEEEEDFEVVEEAIQTQPRRRARVEEEEEVLEAAEAEEEEPPRKKRRAQVEEDEEEEEEEQPRKKRRKKRRKWRGEWAECPNCGAPGDASRLSWTWWGGFIGPLFICHVRCNRCGATYNGKHGDSNTTRIIIYYLINVGIGLMIFFLCVALGVFSEAMNQ
jgi:hypothetical protein